MKDADNKHLKPFRPIAWRSPMTAGDKSLAFLIVLSLAIVAQLPLSACNRTLSTTTVPSPIPYTRGPSPTYTLPPTNIPTSTSTPTATPTSSPIHTHTPPATNTPTAAAMPTRLPTTPVPRASPPLYAPPELQGLDIMGCNVTFKWAWPGTLAEDEWFDVRVGVETLRGVVWVKEHQYTFVLSNPGEYSWEIAICRGDPGSHVCEQLAISGRESFVFLGCGGGPPPPPPAPP